MSEYIINPSWFYWINVVDDARTIAIVMGAIGVTAIIILAILGNISYSLGAGFGKEDEDYIKAMKIFKILPCVVAATVICVLAGVFIPSKDTLIEMQVAKFATYENAEMTIDTIKSAVDYIIDAISSMK